jgi:crotonobetainyl-CoA:carnitine CoA-transferase CaiB-like acyl-CoA transferase
VTEPTGPLQGVRVLEMSGEPAGELTGLHLAQLGADVVKVEPPEGAVSRRVGPFAEGDGEAGLPYWYYNVGKRSVVVDLRAGDDRARFHRLLDEADVLISSLTLADLRALDLDLAELAESHRRLVIVSVTPFGLTGPWAGYRSSDLVALAAGGLLTMCGYDDHSIPPVRPGGNQALHTAASFAQIGTMLALIQRQQTGEGDLVDVAVHDSVAVSCELANPYWFYPGALVQRQTARHAQPTSTDPTQFACADGYVCFGFVLADLRVWRGLVTWLAEEGAADDLADPAYEELTHRQDRFAHILDILTAFFRAQPVQSVYHGGQERGLPIGVVNAPEDVLRDEHLEHRGFFVPVEHPGWGEVRRPGVPFRFSAFPPARLAGPPGLGEHTAEVLRAAPAPSTTTPDEQEMADVATARHG